MRFFLIPNGSKQTMTFWTRWSNLLYFPRGPLKLLTAAKNANVSWLLNFRIRVFLKSAVSNKFKHFFCFSFISVTFGSKRRTFSINSIVKKTWLRHGHFVPNKHARISPEHQLTNWSAMFMCVIVKLQPRDTIYTVYSWFVWWMFVMHIDLKCTGVFLHLVTYIIVFWLMRLCILVHFQMYLGGHSLIQFVVVVLLNLSLQLRKIYPLRENWLQ